MNKTVVIRALDDNLTIIGIFAKKEIAEKYLKRIGYEGGFLDMYIKKKTDPILYINDVGA